jgi:hypothetical protein
VRHWCVKTKAAPAAQWQRLKQQQCNVGGGFGGQRVATVALVAVLVMALVEQWQRWVRQQSNKKTTDLWDFFPLVFGLVPISSSGIFFGWFLLSGL